MVEWEEISYSEKDCLVITTVGNELDQIDGKIQLKQEHFKEDNNTLGQATFEAAFSDWNYVIRYFQKCDLTSEAKYAESQPFSIFY